MTSHCATSEFSGPDSKRINIGHHCSCTRHWLIDLHSQKIARARVCMYESADDEERGRGGPCS
jgi:hypothetical protein